MAHGFNPSTRTVEAGRSLNSGQHGLQHEFQEKKKGRKNWRSGEGKGRSIQHSYLRSAASHNTNCFWVLYEGVDRHVGLCHSKDSAWQKQRDANVMVFTECRIPWSARSYCIHCINCLRLKGTTWLAQDLSYWVPSLAESSKRENQTSISGWLAVLSGFVQHHPIPYQSLRLCFGICLDLLHGRLGIHGLIPSGLTPHLHGPTHNQFEIINWTK